MTQKLHRASIRNFIVILTLLQCTSSQQGCNPCFNVGDNAFKAKPYTNCKEYVQCLNGEVASEFSCDGDTIYDQAGGYCNWPTSVTCEETECPPTPAPTEAVDDGSSEGDLTQDEEVNCPNPCFGINSGFTAIPGTGCKQYVQCLEGQISSPDLTCDGDTIFSQVGGYCDWATSSTCDPVPCPEMPAPTESPGATSTSPTGAPTVVTEKPSIASTVGSTSGSTNGAATAPAFVNTTISETDKNNSSSIAPTPSNSTDTTIDVVDCSNPCPSGFLGFHLWPNTKCQKYAQCEGGLVVEEFTCPSGTMFIEESGSCRLVDEDSSVSNDPYSLHGTDLCREVICSNNYTSAPSPSSSSLITNDTSASNSTLAPVPMPVFTYTIQNSSQPSYSKQTLPQTISIYENLRKYLYQREEMLNAVVFQSQYGPSVEYNLQDMMNALNVVVYQLPVPLSFYVGESNDLFGINYGLVNMAAFLANAMAEGIKTDSCDEWNTDDIDGENWKFPLSNSCGQYGRLYQSEICRQDVDSMCPLANEMDITATSSPLTHGPSLKGPPPFSCQRAEDKNDHAGYYDSLTDTIVLSAFANTVGRTNTAGCCWWGRGALLTRGRCIMGKMNKYLGKQASDDGYNSPYKYIDFCSEPNAICDSDVTRELRWTIAYLEWSDVVQNYVHIDEWGNKWTYWNQLKNFVDGGMLDNQFIDYVINILIRKCHDGTCNDNEILYKEERSNNFRRIIGEVLNLPLLQDFVPDIPTRDPTPAPTPRPTKKPTKVLALPPNAAQRLKHICPLICSGVMFMMHLVW